MITKSQIVDLENQERMRKQDHYNNRVYVGQMVDRSCGGQFALFDYMERNETCNQSTVSVDRVRDMVSKVISYWG